MVKECCSGAVVNAAVVKECSSGVLVNATVPPKVKEHSSGKGMKQW